jgi:hypothetical protein
MDVLRTPEQVAEEADWLRDFHLARTCGEPESLADKAVFTQPTDVFILRCRTCGTVLRNPQPTPEALRQLYGCDTYGKRTLEQLLANEREFFRAKSAMFDFPSGARLLEVGSFVGAFLLACRERGWIGVGVDVGEETCSFTRGLGLEVYQGDVFSLPLNGGFEAVFIWNTFDQINQPGDVLRRVHELIRRAGTLTLRVPNGEFLAASPALAQDDRIRRALAYNNFLGFPYLCGYTAQSLTVLLSRHGFRVESVVGDVILPLGDRDTADWAREEEARTKRQVIRLCRKWEKQRGEFLYPWMDITARKCD